MIIPVQVKPNQLVRRTLPFSKRFPSEFRCIRTEKSQTKEEGKKQNKFLGAKRQTKEIPQIERKLDNYEDDNNHLTMCMICSWEFPLQMDEREKNIHVNMCLEGNGEQNKKEFLESLTMANQLNREELSQTNPKMCPFCGKEFERGLMQHQAKCAKRIIKE